MGSCTTPAEQNAPLPHVVSVNVGRAKDVATGKRALSTAIWKHPVQGRVCVEGVNVEGDEQADRKFHGGSDRAVYAYAIEETGRWEAELGRELGPGSLGENMTTTGLDVSGAILGEHWRVGSALLAVTEPRIPCTKLGLRMGDPRFVKRFARASRPGAFLRIVEKGKIGAGDVIEVVDRPSHGISIRFAYAAMLQDASLTGRVLAVPQLSPALRGFLEKPSRDQLATAD